MMSGGPIERFSKGWAVKVGDRSHPSRAHYYVRDQLGYASSICGAPGALPADLRDIGTWKKCQRCEAELSRREPS